MALTDENGIVDNRVPVTIQGIKEETLTLNTGKKKGNIVSNLKDSGASVSEQQSSAEGTKIDEKVSRLKEEVEELRDGEEPSLTKGNITVNARDGNSVFAPNNRLVQSSNTVDFKLTSELNISNGGSQQVLVEAEETGNNVDSFNDINDILAVDNIDTIEVGNVIQEGNSESSQDRLTELELETKKEQLDRAKRAAQRQEDNIEQLTDSGVLGEGIFTVQLANSQPNISVSTSNRFVEHKTVDGAIIRQKVGKGNVEVTMEGVCTTPEANLLDNLPNENRVFIESNRFQGNVTVDSVSTNPIEDGGGMDIDGNFTHEFSLTLVQVEAR